MPESYIVRHAGRVITAIFLSVCASFVFSQENESKKPDVRLVIDVSGSMKRNDPKT